MKELFVEFGDDYIRIHDKENFELVYWHIDEWIDDPEVVFSIANAVKLAYSDPKLLIKTLKTFKKV